VPIQPSSSIRTDARCGFITAREHTHAIVRTGAKTTGWAWITSIGVAAIFVAAAPLARRRGAPSAGRFAGTALGAFGIQQAAVRAALAHAPPGEPRDLDAVDALTLSRGLCAAIVAGMAASGVRDRRGYAARLAWPLALCGATLTDWIDGPLARRRGRGPSRLGGVLDLELDSWLTLATALAAARLGTLPTVCLVTPSLRYAAMLTPLSYADVFAVGKTDRARYLGITQMLLALASFAPFAGEPTVRIARSASLVLLPIHVVALLAAAVPARD
jgi:phosphatidylglycerophosphate synthase